MARGGLVFQAPALCVQCTGGVALRVQCAGDVKASNGVQCRLRFLQAAVSAGWRVFSGDRGGFVPPGSFLVSCRVSNLILQFTTPVSTEAANSNLTHAPTRVF